MLESQGGNVIYLALGNTVLSHYVKRWSLSTVIGAIILTLAIKIQVELMMSDTRPPNDLYTTLGVSRHSTFMEVRDAYKIVSKKYHPDKFHDRSGKADAHVLFMRAKFSYDTLSSNTQREIYNRFGEESLDFDPRLDETKILEGMVGMYLFWCGMVFYSTTDVAARTSRTWLLLAGLCMLLVEVSFSFTKAEVPHVSFAPALTEHQLVLLLHAIFPAVILVLQAVAMVHYVDVDATLAEALSAIDAQHAHMGRAMGLLGKALHTGRMSTADKEEVLLQVEQQGASLGSLRDRLERLQSHTNDPIAKKYYWLTIVGFYGWFYWMQGKDD